MARRFVDLSIAIEMGVPSDPPGMEPQITYTRHTESVPSCFGKLFQLKKERKRWFT